MVQINEIRQGNSANITANSEVNPHKGKSYLLNQPIKDEVSFGNSGERQEKSGGMLKYIIGIGVAALGIGLGLKYFKKSKVADKITEGANKLAEEISKGAEKLANEASEATDIGVKTAIARQNGIAEQRLASIQSTYGHIPAKPQVPTKKFSAKYEADMEKALKERDRLEALSKNLAGEAPKVPEAPAVPKVIAQNAEPKISLTDRFKKTLSSLSDTIGLSTLRSNGRNALQGLFEAHGAKPFSADLIETVKPAKATKAVKTAKAPKATAAPKVITQKAEPKVSLTDRFKKTLSSLSDSIGLSTLRSNGRNALKGLFEAHGAKPFSTDMIENVLEKAPHSYVGNNFGKVVLGDGSIVDNRLVRTEGGKTFVTPKYHQWEIPGAGD